MKRRFDLVIFDCDGVLIDSEAISARMLITELAARGVEVDLAYVARHFLGRSYPVVLEQIRRDFGIGLPPDFEAEYRARLLAAFDRQLKIMPGVREVLDILEVPFCLATSSSPVRVARSLEIVGLAETFAGRVTTASEVARGKPAPDLFLLACQRMGGMPSRTLVIEDSLNGIQAARAAGMTVWRFIGGSHLGPDTGLEPRKSRPDARFAHFDELPARLPDLVRSESVA